MQHGQELEAIEPSEMFRRDSTSRLSEKSELLAHVCAGYHQSADGHRFEFLRQRSLDCVKFLLTYLNINSRKKKYHLVNNPERHKQPTPYPSSAPAESLLSQCTKSGYS